MVKSGEAVFGIVGECTKSLQGQEGLGILLYLCKDLQTMAL